MPGRVSGLHTVPPSAPASFSFPPSNNVPAVPVGQEGQNTEGQVRPLVVLRARKADNVRIPPALHRPAMPKKTPKHGQLTRYRSRKYSKALVREPWTSKCALLCTKYGILPTYYVVLFFSLFIIACIGNTKCVWTAFPNPGLGFPLDR